MKRTRPTGRRNATRLPPEPSLPVRCRISFCASNFVRRAQRIFHSHPFWQIEFVAGGTMRLLVPDRTVGVLGETDMAFVPPDCRHRFEPLTEHGHYFAIHFDCLPPVRSAVARVLPCAGLLAPLNHALRGCISATGAVSPLEIAVLEYLVAACMFLYGRHRAGQSGEEESVPLPDRLRLAVLGGLPHAVPLRAVAGKVGYSPRHVAALFRRRHGVSFKKFVDRERAEWIKQHLARSDLTLAEIGRAAGFADAAAFSRFVRRVTGRTPRSLRAHLGTARKGGAPARHARRPGAPA